jgi:hypothetical protein
MLPFLKREKEASVSLPSDKIQRKPDEEQDEGELDYLDEIAGELIDAIHAKNKKAAASALHSFFEVCDALPHEEGPHE